MAYFTAAIGCRPSAGRPDSGTGTPSLHRRRRGRLGVGLAEHGRRARRAVRGVYGQRCASLRRPSARPTVARVYVSLDALGAPYREGRADALLRRPRDLRPPGRARPRRGRLHWHVARHRYRGPVEPFWNDTTATATRHARATSRPSRCALRTCERADDVPRRLRANHPLRAGRHAAAGRRAV